MSTNETVLSAISPISIPDDSLREVVQFQHFPVLDGVRGIAVLTVMIYHLELLVPDIHPFVKGGFLGVDIFFVLSGFLITSILLKEQDRDGNINLNNFYIRRLFRLAPAFWTFLIVLYFLGNYILPPSQASIIYDYNNFSYAFFYLMNWHRAASDAVTGNLNHTWSLAIEEQFYIIWSLVLYKAFSEGRTRKQIAFITIGAVFILIVSRAIRAAFGWDVDILYYSTDTRIDALLIGCLASMAYCWKLIPTEVFQLRLFNILAFTSLLAAASILMNFTHDDASLYYGNLSIFAFSIAVLTIWLITRKNSLAHVVLENRLLSWLGKISYGLYLWHYAFYEFAKKTFESVPLQILAGAALALIVSALSFYLIETPFLRLKSRFSH